MVVAVRRLFGAETGNYFLLLGTTLFLVVFGLVMVLSSSSIVSYLSDKGDFFAIASKQGLNAAIGVPLMLIASRMPIRFWKRWSVHLMVGAVVLQLLVFVPGLGVGFQGNHNWIKLGGFTGQPSEIVKLGLVVWLAFILSRKDNLLDDWRHVAIPIGPVAGIAIGLVLLGDDLGTSIILFGMVIGALYFGGVKLRFISVSVIGVAVVGLLFAALRASRTARISAWLGGCLEPKGADAQTACYQTQQGWTALASGHLFGVGLGNSTAKWSWLPEADNDFIYAIVGEELGLIGAILLLVLFIVLAVSYIRIIRMNTDAFARVATGIVMVWIVGEAFVNIAVVLGLLPVLGVPLPLVSSGGSALISTLIATGVVLSFARHETS